MLGVRPAGRGALYAQPLPESLHEPARPADLVVVGAGAMGGWTAYLAQAGGTAADGSTVGGDRRVTLIDAWGAGHPRATSGDETRIIRTSHGTDTLYTRWSRRALELWRRYEREWNVELVLPAGMLWFAGRPDGPEAASARTLAALGIPHERLTAEDLLQRWPQVAVRADLDHILYEPDAGALMARKACLASPPRSSAPAATTRSPRSCRAAPRATACWRSPTAPAAHGRATTSCSRPGRGCHGCSRSCSAARSG